MGLESPPKLTLNLFIIKQIIFLTSNKTYDLKQMPKITPKEFIL